MTKKKITSPSKKEKAPDMRLSYSSGVQAKNCEQKHFWYKGAGVAKDADSLQDESVFNIGKCFHYVMEENGHTEDRLEKLLDEGCKTFEVEHKRAMIHAMLLRYLSVHKKSGLKAIKCELAMSNNEFIGFIDIILADEEGYWWISDLKTAARLSEITLAKLHHDTQLNLYAHFAEEIAGVLELDIDKFMGCRYRVTTKATLKQKAAESYREFVLRLAKNIKSYDVIVHRGMMDTDYAYEEHMRLRERSILIREGKVKPIKNYSQCDAFFRPCEYFSQCHGKTFTELKEGIEMLTSNNV